MSPGLQGWGRPGGQRLGGLGVGVWLSRGHWGFVPWRGGLCRHGVPGTASQPWGTPSPRTGADPGLSYSCCGHRVTAGPVSPRAPCHQGAAGKRHLGTSLRSVVSTGTKKIATFCLVAFPALSGFLRHPPHRRGASSEGLGLGVQGFSGFMVCIRHHFVTPS